MQSEIVLRRAAVPAMAVKALLRWLSPLPNVDIIFLDPEFWELMECRPSCSSVEWWTWAKTFKTCHRFQGGVLQKEQKIERAETFFQRARAFSTSFWTIRKKRQGTR
ncbi:unnamed protein product [Calypogeia fissa]